MRKLNEIPKLQEALQYLNTHYKTVEKTNIDINVIEELKSNFGYSHSIAYDVIALWVEALNTKSTITFLSE